ncbi:hypothetical protein Unana1_05681 [Umbelopsis nana]
MSKVYVLGSTGGVGSQVVKALLDKGVPTTALARDPSKAAQLFGESEHLNVVQGDYADYESFKNSIAGHERLFLLINDFTNMPAIGAGYAKIAYEAGVKQIVHVSSGSAGESWRGSQIGTQHFYAEQGIFNLPNRGAYVTLRPTGFFSNHFFGDHQTIRFKSAIFGSADPDIKRAWISPGDIAQVAANILTEPIEKHGDGVYALTSQNLSGRERAEILSRILGKDISYIQIPIEAEYKAFIENTHFPHIVVYGLVDFNASFEVNEGLPIILHRPVETLDVWLKANKDKFN